MGTMSRHDLSYGLGRKATNQSNKQTNVEGAILLMPLLNLNIAYHIIFNISLKEAKKLASFIKNQEYFIQKTMKECLT